MRWIITCLLITGLFTTAPLVSYAKDVHIDIIEYGIYQAVIERKETASTSANGVDRLKKQTLNEQTDKIPAVLGKRFGYRYRISGDTAMKNVDLIVRVQSPLIKRPSDNKEFSSQEITLKKMTLGRNQYVDYCFSDAWELVPGIWRIQLLMNS